MKYHAPFGSVDTNASYVDKNTAGAVRGSAVPALAIEDPQREIVDVISKAGLTPGDSLQLAAAIQSGKINYAVAGGTANAITATLSPAPPSIPDGFTINVKITATNTDAATLSVNGSSAIAVTTLSGAALQQGDLPVGAIMAFRKTSSAWMVSPVVTQRHGIQVYDTAGTYTFTAPVTGWYRVDVYGAGGGGGKSPGGNWGDAGGGGGNAPRWIYHTAGTTVTVTVGAKGASSTTGAGATGGTSSYGSFVSATGGVGGNVVTDTPGAGGSGIGGDINLTGQSGRDGATTFQDLFPPGGDAAGPFGGKGASNPYPATWPGGGGASGYNSTMQSLAAADGGVIIQY